MFTPSMAQQYQSLFDSMVINPDAVDNVIAITKRIQSNQAAYLNISNNFGSMPYYFVGIIHCMECNFLFRKHIANGDPLNARTTHVPAGLPTEGNPPFDFTEAAISEFHYFGFDKWTDWSIPAMLYLNERWNGMAYRSKGINSPYLWSGSNNYSKGKFVSDGVFDPNAVSQQIGVALILKNIIS